jgi:hypothetical protein
MTGRSTPLVIVADRTGGGWPVTGTISMTEADFQRRVTEAAALLGWRCCHTRRATVRQGRIATPTSVAGWPDLVLWNPKRGGVLFAELKTETGSVSNKQAEVLRSLRAAGASVHVWRPSNWPQIVAVLRGPALVRTTAPTPGGR